MNDRPDPIVLVAAILAFLGVVGVITWLCLHHEPEPPVDPQTCTPEEAMR